MGRGRMPYDDRRHAGRELALALDGYADRTDVVVLALPRGGVPVGYEVAQALGAPLDVFVVRKLGVPDHEELAMGAIASGGVSVFHQDLIERLGISPHTIHRVVADESKELARREELYRQSRRRVDVCGKTAILVDDGLATGATMRAAVVALRQHAPARIVVGVPLGPSETCAELRDVADDVVCADTPEPFRAVGLWYRELLATPDEEVQSFLRDAAAAHAAE